MKKPAPTSRKKQDLALEEAIRKYAPVITFRVRKALAGSAQDAEDIVNEILMQAIEKVRSGEFRGESSLGTFLYTITSRRIVDFIRAKTRVLHHAPEPAPFADPQEEVEAKERARVIREAINRLKPKYRDVIYLYYYQELPREEVARKLGISPHQVSERVNYAVKLVRKEIRN
jgi:RNA polymerase sigma-70 factor (ECF subfamily)